MHIGGLDPHWINRDMLFVTFDYPFNQLGVKRIFGQVPEDNLHAQEFNVNLGFKYVARIEGVFPHNIACMVMCMEREECRFLTLKPRGIVSNRQEGPPAMGGKSKAPKAPDYSAISRGIGNVGEVLLRAGQASAGRGPSRPTTRTRASLTSSSTRRWVRSISQEEWAIKDRARYESVFQPLEEQLAAEAQDYSTPERMEVEAGKAEADVAAQFGQARQTAQDRLESFGVDPSQIRR